eukprot:1176969-Prorocentrum_minimum.AAC.3
MSPSLSLPPPNSRPSLLRLVPASGISSRPCSDWSPPWVYPPVPPPIGSGPPPSPTRRSARVPPAAPDATINPRRIASTPSTVSAASASAFTVSAIVSANRSSCSLASTSVRVPWS